MGERVLLTLVESVQQVHPGLDGIVRVLELFLVDDAALVHRRGCFGVRRCTLLLRTGQAFEQLLRGGQFSTRTHQVGRRYLFRHIFNGAERPVEFAASTPIVLQRSVPPAVDEIGLTCLPQPGVVGPECRRSTRYSHARLQGLFRQAGRLFRRRFLGQAQVLDDVFHAGIPRIFIEVAQLAEAVVPDDDHQLLHEFRQAAGIVPNLRKPRVVLVHVGQGAVVVRLGQFIVTVLKVQVRQGEEALHPRPAVSAVLRQGIPEVVHAELAVQLLQLNLRQGVVNLVAVSLVLVVFEHIEEQLLDLLTVSPTAVKRKRLLHAGLEFHFIRSPQFDHLLEQLDSLTVASVFPLQLRQHEEGAGPVALRLDFRNGPLNGAHGLLHVVLGQQEFRLNEERVCPQFIRGVPLAHRLQQGAVGLDHVAHGHVGSGQPGPRSHLAVRLLVLPLEVFEDLFGLDQIALVKVALANQGVVVVDPTVQLGALEILLLAARWCHGVPVDHA